MLYYEGHITVEPVFGERLALFTKVAETHQFRVADLLMKKRPEDTAERSQFDSFCTGRSSSYADLEARTINLVNELRLAGIKVWRYKIENTVLDSRIRDALLLLN